MNTNSGNHPALLDKQHIPTWYKYIVKPIYYILSPILVPVKLVGVMVPIILSSLIDRLLNLGTDPKQPLGPIRFFIYKLMKRILYRIALFFSGILLIVRGKPNPNVRALMFNHTTMIDILTVSSCGAWSAVSKAGIAKNPLFGPTIRVTRSFLARANQNQDELKARMTETPQRFPPLGVFPGGTTTNQKIFPRFRTGVFRANPTVQIGTVQYYGYENIFYTCISAAEVVKNIIFNPGMVCVITFYDEVYTAKDGEEAQEYANRVGKCMAEKIGGEYTSYDFKDMLWFNGEDKFRDDLSDQYKREQLWRGNLKEWKQRCNKLGLNHIYNWTQEEIEAKEKQ